MDPRLRNLFLDKFNVGSSPINAELTTETLRAYLEYQRAVRELLKETLSHPINPERSRLEIDIIDIFVETCIRNCSKKLAELETIQQTTKGNL